uniref:Capsid protein n=1 Tax=Pink-eared duck picobirnavirus TaxID=2592517 RepID=A0A5B8KEL6_9VIRU|nr:capsid protein [Pink-eared duck picobirnavirus]
MDKTKTNAASEGKAATTNSKSKRNNRSKDFKSRSGDKATDQKRKSGGSTVSGIFRDDNPIIRDAARISMNNNLGMPLKLNSYITGEGAPNQSTDTVIPGIMALDVVPVYGISKDWNSPLNIAARQIYTFVRHVNSGHANYDAANLMMYLLMMDNAYTFHMNLVRAYGFMRAILARNRYLPSTIIAAMGFDFEDLAANMAEFRAYINMYAVRLNAMAVPNVMPIFQRHAAMFSSVFADSDTDKCQMYVYRPLMRWKFNEDAENYGLESVLYAYNPSQTFANIMATGDEILNSILHSEDWNIMSGDILHAYSPENLVRLGTIEEDLVLYPVYDREALLEIHNATICARVLKENKPFTIKESLAEDKTAGALIADYPFITNNKADWESFPVMSDRIIDMMEFEPTPSNVMKATRMSWIGEADLTNSTSAFATMGTEIVADAWIYEDPTRKDGGMRSWSTSGYPNHYVFFDCAPIWYYRYTGTSGTSIIAQGSMTNAAVVSKSTLENIHSAALLTYFGIV